ncbi:MAG: Acg family FMN-binding oxidoreductase [Actinomycetes bacterium]
MGRTPPIRRLVELATRAPSVHNTQPWFWGVDSDRLVLFADRSRQLMHADPDGRDLILSCGAALHHVQVAAAGAGWRPVVRRMPDAYNDAHLANISFHPEPATPAARAAVDALERRRTDRRSPTSSPVPRGQLDRLLGLGPPAGVTIFAVVSRQARTELLQILAEADRQQREDRDYVDEIVRWTGRVDGEGIPSSSLLRRDSGVGRADPVPTGPPPRFPSGSLVDDSHSPEVEPVLLAVCTSSDDTASRLRAGEALGAMLVHGTVAGMAMVPLSQAIEVDRTRVLLQDDLLSDTASPQIVVQVGWAPPGRIQVPLTRRRPVDDVLGDVSSLPPGIGPYHP